MGTAAIFAFSLRTTHARPKREKKKKIKRKQERKKDRKRILFRSLSKASREQLPMASLTSNRYGKDLVRLVRVTRDGPVHHLKDLTVRVLLEGQKLETSYYDGDNSWVVPTDTIKNTVYVLAKRFPFRDIEAFGLQVARHFLNQYQHFTSAQVSLFEKSWERMVFNGKSSFALLLIPSAACLPSRFFQDSRL